MALVLGDVILGNSSGAGVAFKKPVRVVSTINGSINIDFRNGSTVDTVVLTTGDRILIKSQIDAKENGVYLVNSVGSPTRADDFATDINVNGFMVYAEQGSEYIDTMWICTSPKGNDTIGTDNIIFKLLSDTRHPTDMTNPHSTTLEQARLSNNQVSGDIIFSAGTIKQVPYPVTDLDVSNKKYVDDQKLHMIDPRTASTSIVYFTGGALNGFVSEINYANGEKKEITYDLTTKNVTSVKYTKGASIITKIVNYDGNGRVISTSV